MIHYILTGLILAVAFWAKGKMDKSSDGKFIGKNMHLNKQDSWESKYRYPLEPYIKKWYYFGIITPKYKELFPYSTTIFIFVTDYWHWNQFLFLNNMAFAIAYNIDSSLLGLIVSFVSIELIYAISFNISYEKK